MATPFISVIGSSEESDSRPGTHPGAGRLLLEILHIGYDDELAPRPGDGHVDELLSAGVRAAQIAH